MPKRPVSFHKGVKSSVARAIKRIVFRYLPGKDARRQKQQELFVRLAKEHYANTPAKRRHSFFRELEGYAEQIARDDEARKVNTAGGYLGAK